ncbi:MAG TPA: RCC1 domain-containing protein, partial [Myxococcota bacterium]|nr:RCC1 domain-containing protein [Myxococcota bacterium]
SISDTYGCAIAEDHSLICWGGNPFPYPEDSMLEPPAGSFQQVSAGLYHACAITTAGGIECWGSNRDGESQPPE